MLIYIPTLGRATKQITLGNLPEPLREQAFLVVDQKEADAHLQLYGPDKVVIVPENCNSIGKVRQYIVDLHHANVSDKRLIMLDDDLGFNERRKDIRSKFIPATKDAVIEGFQKVKDLLSQHAHGGIRYRQMSQDAPDIDYNCRILRALAYNTEILKKENIRFDRLIVMEDFDVTLQLLRKGYSNFSYSAIIQGQGSSNAAGGCSLYRDAKRQREGAEGLKEHHPDFVKVVEKKTNWAEGWGDTRHDVIIYWKKAYESSKHATQS